MSERPSDGWEIDELREEYDWLHEFHTSMAEKIRGDADVHSLADYVGKLERENDELRELVRELYEDQCDSGDEWRYRDRMRELGIEVGK